MTDKIKETRTAYNMVIGFLIEKTIGLGALKELYAAAEAGDLDAIARINKANATGLAPSGFLLKNLGLIDEETTEALLTAQAAERTLLTIEQMEEFNAVHVPALQEIVAVETGKTGEFKSNFYSPQKEAIDAYYQDQEKIKPADTENKMFAFIGKGKEGADLVLAQATQQVAAEYHRNEQLGIKHQLQANYLKLGNFEPVGSEYFAGFKKSAADSYTKASEVLRQKGYEDVADDILSVVASIDVSEEAVPMPVDCANRLMELQNELANLDNAHYLDPEAAKVRRMQVDPKWENVMTRQARLSLGLTG